MKRANRQHCFHAETGETPTSLFDYLTSTFACRFRSFLDVLGLLLRDTFLNRFQGAFDKRFRFRSPGQEQKLGPL